ncbi:hypothetical protein OV079_36280 [Nannocystis pusilla]|uniref:Uncharacterized protein n=1 Tax=Nannocystis pusilla TaxID=889268 RepID=A0A9X3IZS6_9BACT|nr:hypothetical protein [Nannocystis pusilla]MCY1010932.1 hypothetical protein [Nannocystis pusilla]
MARGLEFLWRRVTMDLSSKTSDMSSRTSDYIDVATLAEVGLCAAALCPPTHPLRQTVERQLRGRQREDGSFGAPVLTALAAQALMALEGAACVQTQRAVRALVQAIEADKEDLGGAWSEGFGLSPVCHDPTAGVREAALALDQFVALGGNLRD